MKDPSLQQSPHAGRLVYLHAEVPRPYQTRRETGVPGVVLARTIGDIGVSNTLRGASWRLCVHIYS